ELVAVAPVGVRREVLCESFADLGDGRDEPVVVAPLVERGRQDRGELVPETLPDARVDALVTQDHEAASRWNDEEQHAVAIARVDHAETLEGPLGGPSHAS